MSTADELLAGAFTSEALKVDLVNRVIHIPDSVKHLGVTSDEDVMKLPFELPRFYGDIDLTEFEININYKNAKGNGDVYTVKEMVIEPDLIIFWWRIDRYVAAHAGKVKFSVCLEKPDASEYDGIGQELNTQPAELPVLEGLETGEAIPEEHPHLYRDLLDRVEELENKIASGDIGGKDEANYIIHGKWLLNSPVNLAGATGKTVVNQANIKYGPAYDHTIVGIVAIDGIGVGYALDATESGTIMVTDFEGVWVDDMYRYLDFGTGKSVSAEFYTWFMSNATKAPAEVVYTLSGKWILNAPVNLAGATGKCSIRNVSVKMGILYDITVYSMVAIDGVGLGYGLDELGENSVMATDFEGALADEKYRYLDFGEGTVVPKEFYEWFTATAVQGVYDEEYEGDVDIEDPDNPVEPDPEEPVEPEVTTYSVTNNLVGCSSSNASATANEGASYSAFITANEGYNLGEVTVLMGGEDITEGVYSDGVVAIYEVTGDIVINATAVTVNKPTVYYALDIVSDDAVSVCINGNEANVRTTTAYVPYSVYPCFSFKLASTDLATVDRLTVGTYDSDGEEIELIPDENGWYTLNQVTTVHITVKPVMYSIEGKYLMNETVQLEYNSVSSSENNEGGDTGFDYGTHFDFMIAIGTGLFYHIDGTNVHVAIASGGEATFVEEGYRYVNFAKQTVSKVFYNWLNANAVKM